MSGQKGRLCRCYRCVYSWHLRRERRPAMCPRCKSKLYDVPKLRPVVLGNGLGIEEIILPHRDAILQAARKKGAEMLWVFGSVRRREATAKSDVDILVRWNQSVSILDRVGLRGEIEDILDRPVDLVNDGALAWPIAPQVESEKVPI